MGSSKNFFSVLMVLVAGIGLWMGGKFLFSIYHYFSLTQEATAKVTEWKVEEFKEGKFVIWANFEFEAQGRTIYGKYLFKKPVYQNEHLPAMLIERWGDDPRSVWFNPKDPHSAVLKKKFPMKEGVYFVLCLGVFLYFAWLRVYVRKISAVDQS